MKRDAVLDRIVTNPINYWGSMGGDIVAIGFFLYFGLTHSSSGVASAIASGLAGLLLWSLLEYVLHRFVLHGPRSAAQHGHAIHHQAPKVLAANPMLSVVVFIFILWFLLRLVMPADLASFLTAGVTTGHLYFGALHHVLHHWKGSQRYLSRRYHYHKIHHRSPGANYGSTTMIWDRVFGTFDAGEPIIASREQSDRSSGSRRSGR